MTAIRRSQSGFTMVEVVIALFAVAALVVLGCWLLGFCSEAGCGTPKGSDFVKARTATAPSPAPPAYEPDPVLPLNSRGTLVFVKCPDLSCVGSLRAFLERYEQTHAITPIGPQDVDGYTRGYYFIVRPCPQASPAP